MIFGIFLLVVALSISAVAAYYSIAGLAAIFAAAVIPIIIMGAVLEVGKIAATVWLHRFWDRAALQFKLYLVPAILVLMLVTSMGIFGFLSKAHLDQTAPAGDLAAQVALIDEKIMLEQENIQGQRDNIDAAKQAIRQLDQQVNEMLGRTTNERGANRSVQIRRQQAKERTALQKEIAAAQQEIEKLNNNIIQLRAERAPIASEVRKVEAEVGPIKYIAALIYGDNPDADLLERAVRWVIILLVLVFDPLALVLILAAEQTFRWHQQDQQKFKKLVPVNPTPQEPSEFKYELDDGALTDAEIDEINRLANVRIRPSTTLFTEIDSEEEFFQRGRDIARELDQQAAEIEKLEVEQVYLKRPWSWIPASNRGLVPDPEPKLDADDYMEYLDEMAQEFTPAVSNIPADNAQEELPKPPEAGFGIEFPLNPTKGLVFLRVDMMPNKLYKWNGMKWIEIDKSKSNQYLDNKEYIQYLLEKIRNREITFDDLTDAEKDEILPRLSYREKTRLI